MVYNNDIMENLYALLRGQLIDTVSGNSLGRSVTSGIQIVANLT